MGDYLTDRDNVQDKPTIKKEPCKVSGKATFY